MLILTLALHAHAGVLATVEISPEGTSLRHAVLTPSPAIPNRSAVDHVAIEALVQAQLAEHDPRQRSIIFPEGGGESAVLDRAVIRVEVPWPLGATAITLGDQRLIPQPAPAQEAVRVQKSGPSEERLDLVFLGDGYRSGELGTFKSDVNKVVDYLLTIEPYGSYTGMFNVWRVDRASAESGVSHDELGTSKDTAYGCYYGCANIDRLICCDDNEVMTTAADQVPGADGVMVLINDPVYGGAGGFNYATAYTGPGDGVQVAAHELGHSLVGLWDEYGYGTTGYGEGSNCSSDPNGHWDQWVGTQGVDAFQECSYNNLYRPTLDGCMMRTLQDDYCPVCREQAIFAMYRHLPSLVSAITPEPGTALDGAEATPFEIEAVGPDSGLVYEWSVDGEVFLEDEPHFDLRCSGANGELTLRVYDPTKWVRDDPEGLLEQRLGPWQVSSEPCASVLDEIDCQGCASSPAGGGPWLLVGLLGLLRRRR